MSEEEIIKILSYQINMKGTDIYTPINYDAIQGLLDLYNKQKEEIEQLKNAEEYTKLGKETLLDTIHKQQKEIEELNKEFALNTEIHKRDEEIKELKETIKCLHEPAENYISKDKIRERIKELDKDLSGREKIPARPELYKQIEMEVLENLLLEIEVLEKML